jgi:hypothetical protein
MGKKIAKWVLGSLMVLWGLSLLPGAVASEAQNDFVNIVGKDVGIDVQHSAVLAALPIALLPGIMLIQRATRSMSISPCDRISSASTPFLIAPQALANPSKTFLASHKREESSERSANYACHPLVEPEVCTKVTGMARKRALCGSCWPRLRPRAVSGVTPFGSPSSHGNDLSLPKR